LSLLEVLLSLLVFVVTLAAIGQLYFTGVNGALRARLQTEAILRAETVLGELLGGVLEFESVGEARFEDDPNWTYTIDISTGPAVDLFQVDVRVDRAGANSALGQVAFELTTFVRDPQLFLDAAADAAE
jgi:Tfp pilus assembly protein PilV